MNSLSKEDHAAAAERLRISEIFLSLQGESTSMGLPTVFVRLTGCPLRCRYCDTSYAFRGGKFMDIPQLLGQVSAYRVKQVTVTGGEPLAQPACLSLLRQLCDTGYSVSLETSGALDISGVDPRVSRVLDLKTPGSGEHTKNRYINLDCLTHADQIKFVICDRSDYAWAKRCIEEHRLTQRCELLFSPAYGELDATQLADWIVEDRLPVRFQLQLHKILWGDEPGR